MAGLTPRRLGPDSPEIPVVLALIREAFAFMEGRIDPPSSMHRLTVAALRARAGTEEIWAIGTPPVACMVLTPRADALYVGKLAVADSARRQGLARVLFDLAEVRARARGLRWLELETRAELVENQATFRALGFIQSGESAHDGYDRITSLRFRRAVPSEPVG